MRACLLPKKNVVYPVTKLYISEAVREKANYSCNRTLTEQLFDIILIQRLHKHETVCVFVFWFSGGRRFVVKQAIVAHGVG